MGAFATDQTLCLEDYRRLRTSVAGNLDSLKTVCERFEVPLLAAAMRATSSVDDDGDRHVVLRNVFDIYDYTRATTCKVCVCVRRGTLLEVVTVDKRMAAFMMVASSRKGMSSPNKCDSELEVVTVDERMAACMLVASSRVNIRTIKMPT